MAALLLVVVGFGLSGFVAFTALRAKALSEGGAVAAIVVGTLTFAGLNIPGTVILLLFFVSSVALSRFARTRSRGAETEKGATRDALQVLANGGVGAVCAAWAFITTLSGHTALVPFFGFAGAFAAATADTWATEIGTALGGTPRSIVSGRPLTRGMSGGVSRAGLIASVLGAVTIALAVLFVNVWIAARQHLTPVELAGGSARLAALIGGVAAAGVAGSIVDSLAGALLQIVRRCDHCDTETEQPIHRCGTATRSVRGVPWINNDAVNALATASGAAVAAGVAWSAYAR